MMAVAFAADFAMLIIGLAILRLGQVWLLDKYGPDNALVKAIAFID